MRGTYRGEERASLRQVWATQIIPEFEKVEVAPLNVFMRERKDIIAIDIGANKGFWSKCMIDNFDVKHIYMIDASLENFNELRNEDDNLVFEARHMAKVSAYQYAMGARRGMACLYTNEEGSPLASLYSHKVNGEDIFGALNTTITVPMNTIDHFLAEHREIRHVDIVKMDVEGHELQVLSGAHGAIANRMIDLIAFEFGIHQVESRNFFRDFYYLFRDNGYVLHIIDHEGNINSILSYDYRYENFTTVFTFVAEKKG